MSRGGAARRASAGSGARMLASVGKTNRGDEPPLVDGDSAALSSSVVRLAAAQPDIVGARLWRLSGNKVTVWQEAGKVPSPIGSTAEKVFFSRSVTRVDPTCWACPVGELDQMIGVLEVFGSKPLTEKARRFLGLFSRVAGLALFGEDRQQDVAELSTIVEVTKRLNSALDLGQLMGIILQLAVRLVGADRGTVFLLDNKRNELWSLVGLGLEEREIRLSVTRGIAGWVAIHGESVNIQKANEDPRFEPDVDRHLGYHTRNLLCLPIRNEEGEIVGVLELLNKHAGSFTAADERAISHLSNHVAVALEKARLHRESLVKQRMERDLELARSVQQGLLPEHSPQVEGFEFGVTHAPSQMVSGDYYDFITLNHQALLIVIADVEGKGVASALVMANLQATLRALAAHVHSLQQIISSVNKMILTDTRAKKFLSMFVGLLDKRNRALHYVNAGHVQPAVIRADGETTFLTEGGTLIGLFPDSTYERGFMQLRPGDIVVGYSDGITEARDIHGNEFGVRRLVEAASAERGAPAQQIAQSILGEADRFSRGGPLDDDRLVLILKVS